MALDRTRTRFAPSPTGYMHVGNLRTALYAYLTARRKKGDFILRIEDTDQSRQVEGAVEIIYNTLKETHLLWDEGPDIGGPYGPYVQSERKEIYKKYAEMLVEKGAAYYCFCTKERLEEVNRIKQLSGQIPGYDNHCRNLSKEEVEEKLAAGVPYVIRQNIPTTGITTFDDMVYGHIEVQNNTLNEGILIKSDGYPTYNFANVIDDHLMQITHVVRGNEYLSSTPKYNLIYEALGWDIPIYIHLPSVNKDETHKLSKRHGDASYQDLKKQGFMTAAIINYIALLGWSPKENEILSLDELISQFDINHISKAPAIFDIEKLKWINGMYIKKMPLDQFHQLIKPYYNFISKPVDLLEISRVLQPRLLQINAKQIQDMLDFINQPLPFDLSVFSHKKFKTDPQKSLQALILVKENLHHLNNCQSDEDMLQFFRTLAKENSLKNGQIMEPVRAALTQKRSSPGGAVELIHILTIKEATARLNQTIRELKNAIEKSITVY